LSSGGSDRAARVNTLQRSHALAASKSQAATLRKFTRELAREPGDSTQRLVRPLQPGQEMRSPLEVIPSAAALLELFPGRIAGAASLINHSLDSLECPSCAWGRQAWSRVVLDHFGFNALVALAPLLVVLAFAAVVEVTARRPVNDRRLPTSSERVP
jgi:hypothetical protein